MPHRRAPISETDTHEKEGRKEGGWMCAFGGREGGTDLVGELEAVGVVQEDHPVLLPWVG